MRRSCRFLLLPLLVLASLVAAGTAQAGVLTSSAPDCDAQALSRPFLRWADPFSYFLVPDGSFSAGGEGWTLAGASIAAESAPQDVSGSGTESSLRLPTGASATSPAVCVGILEPTTRFFVRNTGSVLGSLKVEVLFEDAAGNQHALPVGLVTGLLAGRSWSPSLPQLLVANLLPLLPGDHTAIALRFTAVGPQSGWLVDDVYVDPYMKG
jgi:hypothetical protein